MDKIIKELGLPTDATEADIIAALKDLKSRATGKNKPASEEEREKLIAGKMAAGLSREVAAEAVENQIKEDAARKKDK